MTEGPRGTFESDAARVRLVLMRELETISVYEALAREAQSPEAKVFFDHLAAEEKEHVAEATWLLRKLDPGQESRFQATYSEAHFAGAAASSPGPSAPAPAPFIPEDLRLPSDPRLAPHAIPAPTSPVSGSFTVGPLKPRR